MLATAAGPAPPTSWTAEWKWDGLRAAVRAGDGTVEVRSRSGAVISSGYPELAVLSELAAGRSLVLDGEIVVEHGGRPDFEPLQQRMHRTRPSRMLLETVPVSYIAFDVLAIDDQDCTGWSYHQRRDLLEGLGLHHPPRVQVPAAYPSGDVDELLDIARDLGLEGLVLKRPESRYRSGRSSDWVKVVLRRQRSALIGGWVPGSGRHRATVGSLLIGAWAPTGALVYLGQVGSGLRDRDRRTLRDGLAPLQQQQSPFSRREFSRGVHWVEPAVVCEVAYREVTGDGVLRHPSWLGLRTDIRPHEVTL